MDIITVTFLCAAVSFGASYVADRYILWPRKLKGIVEMENLYRERYRIEPPGRPPDLLDWRTHVSYEVLEYRRMLREATSY